MKWQWTYGPILQSRRRQVYLLQVLHLFLWWAIYKSTSIDGDTSIKELWQLFKIDGDPVTDIPGDSRTALLPWNNHLNTSETCLKPVCAIAQPIWD